MKKFIKFIDNNIASIMIFNLTLVGIAIIVPTILLAVGNVSLKVFKIIIWCSFIPFLLIYAVIFFI